MARQREIETERKAKERTHRLLAHLQQQVPRSTYIHTYTYILYIHTLVFRSYGVNTLAVFSA